MVPVVEEYRFCAVLMIQVDKVYSRADCIPTFVRKLMNVMGRGSELKWKEREGKGAVLEFLPLPPLMVDGKGVRRKVIDRMHRPTKESESSQETLKVLDIILRQHVKQEFLLDYLMGEAIAHIQDGSRSFTDHEAEEIKQDLIETIMGIQKCGPKTHTGEFAIARINMRFWGTSDVLSIAAMVSSRWWPLISSYGASGRTQYLKLKMIDSFFKNQFLTKWMTRVSIQSSFDQVIEACKFLDEKWNPKDCGYYCTKNHHTKFFQQGSSDNVLHGTVIDNKVCHRKNNDFLPWYPCWNDWNHEADHYYVLRPGWFSADDLQDWGQFIKIRDPSETSSSHGGMYAPGVISVPQLSRLKDKVSNFILVC
ncbi:hypothetical protein CXB51_003939 [Gossypium anomalum]|uniref:Piwi domain-containing protein n=1 Tax=Gossypium anomalum TaxID=47600 RepID=A0A8J5ZLY0_9ROSI|nr:hypothetical protein CXB51_003939 [Gossypium anomalum]